MGSSGPRSIYAVENSSNRYDRIYTKSGGSERELSSDERLLAQCIFAEAVSLGHRGMLGVACVIRNRVNSSKREFGNGTYRGVILKKGQFTCATPPGSRLWRSFSRASRLTGSNKRGFQTAVKVSLDILSGAQDDITNSAFFYMTPGAAQRAKWLKHGLKFGKLEKCYEDIIEYNRNFHISTGRKMSDKPSLGWFIVIWNDT